MGEKTLRKIPGIFSSQIRRKKILKLDTLKTNLIVIFTIRVRKQREFKIYEIITKIVNYSRYLNLNGTYFLI